MIINNSLVKGEIKILKPNIFGVSIADMYDRAMLFCRYQEFYESPFKTIRGKNFTLEQYMCTYTKANNQTNFTYPRDWSGFNVPSNVLNKANKTFTNKTEYDKIMLEIITHCNNEVSKLDRSKNPKWYLIGADTFKSKTMNHEIAHGLYYTNTKYKKEMNNVIDTLKKGHYNKIYKELVKMGYVDDKKIIDDEIQAYMSTGLLNVFGGDEIKKYQPEFIRIFNKFAK